MRKHQKGSDEDKKTLFVSACQFVGLLNETKEDWLKFKKSKVLISEKEILIKINKEIKLERIKIMKKLIKLEMSF